MELYEALNILKYNNYILEKLEYNEDRYEYIPNLSPKDKLKKISSLRYGNDGYNFRHFNNISTKRLKDIELKDVDDFKKLILNGGVFGKGLFKHKSKKDDLIDIIKYPERFTNTIKGIKLNYGIDFDTLKYMIEDDDSIDDVFDMCLFVWFKYLKKLFKNVYYKKLPIYRGICLPENENAEDFLKKHTNLGTSWSISKETAYNFGGNTGKGEKGYIITAYLNNINNIDITTSMLWWYKVCPFADNDVSESEIRIRNSRLLKIESIIQIV